MVNSTPVNTVTPIDLATNTAGAPINVDSNPVSIAFTPDGIRGYVTNNGANTVTPITVATNTPGAPITVGDRPYGIAITPDGTMAYVANFNDGTVTPITRATDTPGTPIAVAGGSGPIGITIAPLGPPTARIDTPAGNGTYTVGQAVPTSFSCADAIGGPGILTYRDSNHATGGSGALDTTTTGPHTYTVTATSRSGKVARATITYRVEAAPGAPAALVKPTARSPRSRRAREG